MANLLSSMFGSRHSSQSEMPSHSRGTAKGEEWVQKRGREPGRNDPRAARVARDSTSVDAPSREPIDPRMPHIPPV